MWHISRSSLQLICVLLLSLFCVSCSQQFAVVKAKRSSSGQIEHNRTANLSSPTETYVRDALLLYRQGDFEASKQMFTKALGIDPISWQSHYYLGRILTQTNEPVEAEQQLMLALDYAPKDKKIRSMAYLGLAILYEASGMAGKAELNYNTALKLNPQSRQAAEGVDRLAERAQR